MGKMMHRYYATQRPPTPGAIPAGAWNICCYEERRYVPEIDRMAWGWVEYRETLTPEEISDFELVSEPREDG
ncbi:MAG: hypothetical protein J6N18_11595 [Kiritimatiellae bacterium]|nr:hypothetical protein [Kiritimatiellia bacterium]